MREASSDKSKTSPAAMWSSGTTVKHSGGRPDVVAEKAAVFEELVTNLRRQVSYLEGRVSFLLRELSKKESSTVPEECREGAEEVGNGRSGVHSGGSTLRSTSEEDQVRPIVGDDVLTGAATPVAQPGEGHGEQLVPIHINARTMGLFIAMERLRAKHALDTDMLQCEKQAKDDLIEENSNLRLQIRELQRKMSERGQLQQALNVYDAEEEQCEDTERVPHPGFTSPEKKCIKELLDDVICERDYYKAQTDRLRVSNQELSTRIGVLQEQLKAENTQMISMESSLLSVMQELHSTKQLHEKKFTVYERLDRSCAVVVKQMQEAVGVCESAQQRILQYSQDDAPTSTSLINFVSGELLKISAALDVSKYFVGDSLIHANSTLHTGSCNSSTEEVPSPPAATEEISASPAATIPAPPAATIPAPPAATIPAPPVAAVPAPPAAAVPAPPAATVPAPPAAAVPAPPAATIPAPPVAAVPAPPVATVPAPPVATVPAPPAATVPAPPTAAVPGASIVVASGDPPTVGEELEALSHRISEAETVLLSYLKGAVSS